MFRRAVPVDRGGHSPKVVTPNPKATNIPKGPAPGARRSDGR